MSTPAHSAAQLGSIAAVEPEGLQLLSEGMGPRDFVERLVENGSFADAVRVVAHALPKRESVWWAWVCARRAAGADPPATAQAALTLTERWIAQPNEENRRAAMKAAQAAGFDTPAGCAGLAAFLSGPSLAPPDAQAVPPGAYDSARAVAGAVTLGAVAVPEMAAETFRSFIQQGIEVAVRIKLW